MGEEKYCFASLKKNFIGCPGSSLLCLAWAGRGQWGLHLIAVCTLLIAVASLVEHGLQVCKLQ